MTPDSPTEFCAPFAGVVRSLDTVPDPVFAQEIVGPGVAVEPLPDKSAPESWTDPIAVHAPISGTIATMLPHACAIELPSGRSVLLHLGIDTVELKGAGFSAEVTVGDLVTAGQHIMTWTPAQAVRHGCALVSPVVAVQANSADLVPLVSAGDAVVPGQLMLRWN